MKKPRLSFAILILVAPTILIAPIGSDFTVIAAVRSDFTFIDAYWGTTQKIEVSPGDVATLTIILRCESSQSLRNLEAILSLPGLEAVGGGTKASAYLTGPVSQGSLVKLDFQVFITHEAKIGNHVAALDLRYYLSSYLIPQDTLEVSIEVTGKPRIGMKVLNDSLYEGKQQILVALSNDGDAVAKNLRVQKVYSSTAATELETAEFLGNLEPKANVTVPLSLFVPTGMKNKVLPLALDVSCLGPTNVAYSFSETLQIPVKSSNPMPPITVSLDPQELSIGKSSKVYMDLKNTGDHSLSEIRLALTPDAILKVFGPTDLYIDRLGSGGRKRIETEVYVPSTTTAPTGSLTVDLTYVDEDAGLSQTESHRLNILLRGLIEISLTDTAVIPSTPRSGSPFSITITVTNIGTSIAYAAYAIPSLENLPLNTFGPRSTYIGNVEINLPTTFTLNLQLQNTTERSLTLPVILSYMDNLRSLRSVTFNIPISVAPQTGSSGQQSQQLDRLPGGGLLIGSVAAVVVAVIVIIVIIRRRR